MKIKEYIEKENLSVTKFAKKIGISRMSVYRLMAGTRGLRLETAQRIVEATNGDLTLQDLLHEIASNRRSRKAC